MGSSADCTKCGQQHERCAGHARGPRPCQRHPVRGLDKCTTHSGMSRANAIAKGRDNLERQEQERAAREMVATYGQSVEVDPHTALLEEIHRTAGHVAWLADLIGKMEAGDLVWGRTEIAHIDAHISPGTNVHYQAVPSIWLTLYQRERDHLAKVAAAAIKAGIEERRVQLAEQQGDLIVEVIQATLRDLGVDLTPKVAETVGRNLRLVG